MASPSFHISSFGFYLSFLLLFVGKTSAGCRWGFMVGRKELRDKETCKGNVIKLLHSIKENKIDPSRAYPTLMATKVRYLGLLFLFSCCHFIKSKSSWLYNQLGIWSICIAVFYRMRNVTTLFLWHLEQKKRRLGTGLHSDNVFMNQTQLTTEDNIVARIEERISSWTFLPKENSKPLKVMHYGLEEDKQKLDYFGNKSKLGLSERLMATVILYLSNVTQGGEIQFPDSTVKNKMGSDCTKVSDVQRPIKGNAILFFTLHPNASRDESSSHARCPVLEGEMWCAAKFFQVRDVNKEKVSIESDGDECTDEDEDCPHWAAIGECQRNPVFMIGSPDYYGTCRKSCSAC
ncbi:hypothetical protein Patl1_20145 [Pistacia atlantica]|uniref:Uncharacterized protein n=1 Tax=Pistacia atlantica TaxID=434234 RepID=A0ACC1BIP6_9ROSI|nr:hypothetical protein Patl1_20145 [Pistacia atlantica]